MEIEQYKKQIQSLHRNFELVTHHNKTISDELLQLVKEKNQLLEQAKHNSELNSRLESSFRKGKFFAHFSSNQPIR